MPRDPPVTTAALPVRSIIITSVSGAVPLPREMAAADQSGNPPADA
jgi:hypothetical protein